MAVSMPRHDEPRAPVTEAEVVAHLARSRRPQSLREIAAALDLRHSGRRALVKLARKMKKRGEIHEYPNGRVGLPKEKQGAQYAQPPQKGAPQRHGSEPRPEARSEPRAESRPAVRPEANQLTGRLVAHRDGYGFVVPDTPRKDLEGDLFIGRDAIGDAMHGDHVLASIERRKRFGDGAGPGRAEGRILRVINRAHGTVVGLFRYGSRGNTVAPYESRLLQEIIIPPGDELTPELQGKLGQHQPKRGVRLPELDGAVVNVEMTRFPRGGVAPAGRVIEILGRPGDFGVDVEILIRKHHLPHEFSAEVLAEAAAVAHPVGDAERAGRRDFRDLPIVTIDGETARDFDDAVYVKRLENGNWQLQVHIADVSHYVRRGSALDREARLRGTSVYFPNRAVPMLPEELSNGICSLNPQEDRLVMSAILELDANGEIVASEFARGVIRSAERMTYTAVNAVLQNDAAATAQYAHLAENFRAMRDLAMILNARRARLGSIDFDLPEQVIEFDAAGQMTGIVRSERNIAHRLIEEFMLAANQAVARYLESRGIGSLHRVHEKPDPKKILEFEALAQTFGYSLGVGKSCGAARGSETRKFPPAAIRSRRAARPARRRPRETDDRLAAGRDGHRHSPGALPAPGRKNRGQARGAHRLLPDAAFAEAGALRRRRARPFRAGLRPVHAFHFADPPLSRPDRASRVEVGARSSRDEARGPRGSRQRKNPRSARIAAANSKPSPRKLPRPSAAPKPPSAN